MSYEMLEKQIKALPEEAVKRIELYVKDVAKMYAISDEDWPKRKLHAAGILSKYANPSLIPLEEGAWERDVVRRYSPGGEDYEDFRHEGS